MDSLDGDRQPRRVRWAYALGSALLLLLLVQLATGVTLMLYYVPTPTHAYDSVRYIVSEVPFGALVRGLHYHGASFIVAITVLHLLHTAVSGSYKAPREVTWLSGFVLLILIVGFGLTGYLLPWDQTGYWATVVRANIAGTTPLVGPWVARLMKGGPNVGALTLSRWYALHVAVLPAGLVLFVVGHVYLVWRHGRAGHYAPVLRAPSVMPRQSLRNIFVATAAFAVLAGCAALVRAPLESMADAGDFGFIPHPEWYFLWLFQLMKLTQGPFEQIGAPVVLMLVIAFLVLLPFLDRIADRHPFRRAWVMAVMGTGLAGITALTWIALRTMPPDKDPNAWSPIAIAGQDVATRSGCLKCHGPDSVAPNLARGRVARDNAWIKNHLSDPDTMAPGIRPVPFDAPTRPETGAVIAFVRMVRSGAPTPHPTREERAVALNYTVGCASCHMMDGDGVSDGPDLTHAGRNHDADWIARKITAPMESDPNARMPSLKDKMSAEDVRSMAEFLARRK